MSIFYTYLIRRLATVTVTRSRSPGVGDAFPLDDTPWRPSVAPDEGHPSFPSSTFAVVSTGSHTGLYGGAYARS